MKIVEKDSEREWKRRVEQIGSRKVGKDKGRKK